MTTTTIATPEFGRLRLYNLVMGSVHALQALVILALSNDFGLPVTTTYLEGAPGTNAFSREIAFDIRVGPAVALFLAISAVAHFLVASPRVYEWYEANLRRGINYVRWYEYSVSASVMIVLITMLTGVSDAGALIAIFGVNASMLFFGLLMEVQNQGRERIAWTPFVFGCIAGAVPWIVIAIQVIGSERSSDQGVPGFVYGIMVSLFLFFNSFAVNMWLQYKKVGPWRNYVFGERVYVLLSLTAKSALAWQVFSGTLIG